jgi:hypothetical protein
VKNDSPSNESRYAITAQRSTRYRNFFVTKNGYFGLGPECTKLKDLVVIFDGDTTGFLLRQIEWNDKSDDLILNEEADGRFSHNEQYVLIRECYVHGLMDNEVVTVDWGAKRQKFWIK